MLAPSSGAVGMLAAPELERWAHLCVSLRIATELLRRRNSALWQRAMRHVAEESWAADGSQLDSARLQCSSSSGLARCECKESQIAALRHLRGVWRAYAAI